MRVVEGYSCDREPIDRVSLLRERFWQIHVIPVLVFVSFPRMQYGIYISFSKIVYPDLIEELTGTTESISSYNCRNV